MIKKTLFLVLIVILTIQSVKAQEVEKWVVERYETHEYEGMPYRLMRPLDFNKDKKYPVILSLHGAGGKGNDNVANLRIWNQYLAEHQIRKDYPCYVLAPQSNKLWDESQLSMIKNIIKDLKSVDVNRIYVIGHSMGGSGTYIYIQLDPGYFAAAAPSAGSGLATTEDFIDVTEIKNMPIWVFHGDKDPKCPYEKDRKVFEDMKKLKGNMKFTTWVGDKHGGPVALKMVTGSDNAVTEVSSDLCDNEPIFLKWLFNQKLKEN